MRGLVLSAPSSGQGKTVITLGLLRALRDRGVKVVSAKSGPDYIDPAFHAAATSAPCVTLDAWAAGPGQLRARATMQRGEMLVVEGAMGLFDGASRDAGEGRGATAAVARALGLPVVLVIDAAGMGQSAGAVAAGFANWSPDIRIAGVILNRVASARHDAMLRDGLSGICPVLGAIPRDEALSLPSRHLGLVQAGELAALEERIAAIAAVIAAHSDLDGIIGAAAEVRSAAPPERLAPLGQRIAVARDEAFGFAYWHLLEDWRAQGAEIFPFSPLADQPPHPDADAIFLPGGYPELHLGKLARVREVSKGITRAVALNAKIYGECGGYMFLGDTIVDETGRGHPMLGLLRLTTNFQKRQRHLGYREFTGAGALAGRFAAHEFHYALTDRAAGEPLFQSVTDGAGNSLPPMGLRDGNVMGSFAHLIERIA
ncbi:MAG: cobyrinate a,c-diamide synthase [Pseudomonadota bacterium]